MFQHLGSCIPAANINQPVRLHVHFTLENMIRISREQLDTFQRDLNQPSRLHVNFKLDTMIVSTRDGELQNLGPDFNQPVRLHENCKLEHMSLIRRQYIKDLIQAPCKLQT